MVEFGFAHDALNAMDEAEFRFWLTQRNTLIEARNQAAKERR